MVFTRNATFSFKKIAFGVVPKADIMETSVFVKVNPL